MMRPIINADYSYYYGGACTVIRVDDSDKTAVICLTNGYKIITEVSWDNLKPISTKPFWSDVPEGYDWMAQDKDGVWHAFAGQPIINKQDDYWIFERPTRCHLLGSRPITRNPNWKDTLERRPGKGGPYIHTFTVPGCGENVWANVHAGEYRDRMMDMLIKGFTIFEGDDMNNCPTVKTLEPQERIQGKIDRINAEIEVLADRLGAIDDINCSINWKTATDEIKNKAVEAADSI